MITSNRLSTVRNDAVIKAKALLERLVKDHNIDKIQMSTLVQTRIFQEMARSLEKEQAYNLVPQVGWVNMNGFLASALDFQDVVNIMVPRLKMVFHVIDTCIEAKEMVLTKGDSLVGGVFQGSSYLKYTGKAFPKIEYDTPEGKASVLGHDPEGEDLAWSVNGMEMVNPRHLTMTKTLKLATGEGKIKLLKVIFGMQLRIMTKAAELGAGNKVVTEGSVLKGSEFDLNYWIAYRFFLNTVKNMKGDVWGRKGGANTRLGIPSVKGVVASNLF
jgi:hypothetical protein